MCIIVHVKSHSVQNVNYNDHWSKKTRKLFFSPAFHLLRPSSSNGSFYPRHSLTFSSSHFLSHHYQPSLLLQSSPSFVSFSTLSNTSSNTHHCFPHQVRTQGRIRFLIFLISCILYKFFFLFTDIRYVKWSKCDIEKK